MANKTITQVPAGFAQVDRLTIDRAGAEVTCVATYHIADDAGNTIGANRVLTLTLTPAQKTALKNFITNDVLPAINAAEGT